MHVINQIRIQRQHLAACFTLGFACLLICSQAAAQDQVDPTDNQDTLQLTADQAAAQAQTPAVDPQQRRQQLVDRLSTELDDLIPGTYADGSEQKQKLVDVATFFMDRNEAKIRTTLSQLATLDENVPPQELLLAGLAYATNNMVQGKTILERAAIQHQDHPGFPLAFARLALLQTRYYDALALAEKTRAVNQASKLPDEVKQFYEAEVLDIQTTVELRRNQLDAAAEHVKRWEQASPKSDKMLLAAGEINFLQEKVDDAMAYLNRRSEKLQNEFPTEGVLAKWYLGKHNVDEYRRWVQKAYEKHPSNGFIQVEYAAWLLRQEEFDRALAVVEKFEADKGASTQSKLIKGRIAFSKQDYAAAEPVFAELFRQQPNNLEHMYLYSLALLESPDPQKQKQAVQLAQRNYQLNTSNQLTASILGWSLFKTGSKEVGRQLLMQTAKAGQLLPDPAYMIAMMMVADNRMVQAKIILSPHVDSPSIFIYRSRAKELMAALESVSVTDDEELPDPSK